MGNPIDITDLLKRIEALERALGVAGTESKQRPFVAPFVAPFPAQFPPKQSTTKCPKCGVDWSDMMGYSCPDIECPVQPKVTC